MLFVGAALNKTEWPMSSSLEVRRETETRTSLQ